MKKKIKILVCCHKPDSFIRNDGPYMPIQVGKALHPDVDLGFQCDNEGDNISDKNPQYCELTALYWGWKNLKDVEYKGLCHYRRYFGFDGNDPLELLNGKDILVINKSYQAMSMISTLAEWTSWEDVCIFSDTLIKMYPDYKEDFEKYFLNGRYFFPCTMFIARAGVYDKFCEFIFPLFFELEKRLKPHGYSRLNRFIAYCGEVILGLFILHEGLEVKTVSMLFEGKKMHRMKYIPFCRMLFFTLTQSLFLYNRKRKHINNFYSDVVTVGLKNDGIRLDSISKT